MSNDNLGQPEFETNVSPLGNPKGQLNRLQRRRAKIADEVARNRAGGHKIPTWALAAALVLVLLGWALLIFLP